MKIHPPTLLAYKLGIISRIIAASLGCYAFINIFTLMFAYALPGGPEKGLFVGNQISFLLFPFGVIWVFSAKTALRAWLGLTLVSVPPVLILLFFMITGELW